MALMCTPALLLADEPTTALDVTIQVQVLRLLRDLQGEFDLGMLLITHDLGVVARMSTTVAVMYAGELVETGTRREMFRNPAHPYTRGLLASIPTPSALPPGARLASIGGSVPNLAAAITGCAFRGRCAYAMAECAAPVPLRVLNPGRSYRCILPATP